MTGNLYLDLLISLAGIGVMVGVSFLLGAWKNAPVDAASAMDRLAFDEPDFNPVRWMIGADKRAAAALSPGGEAAFIFAQGDGLATRRFKLGAFKVEQEGTAVTVSFGDVTKPKIRLAAVTEIDAADWAGSLRG